jgi:hypothetical protein
MKISALSLTWLARRALLLSSIHPATSAERVGVAAAVKPDATSQPPGGETATLRIGKSVLYNERINTSGSGVVQVLLLDGSTFTRRPGLEPRQRQIRLYPRNRQRHAGRELLQGGAQIRRRQAVEKRARGEGQYAGQRAHRAWRHRA